MKVLVINTSDTEGGAARAAHRLHHGLSSIGVSSQMLVQDKSSDNTAIGPQTKVGRKLVKLRPILDNLPLQLYPKRDRVTFSPQWLPDSILPKVVKIRPDIVNLHWSCGGYLQIETISKFHRPLVWTLHDMWAFTGGCHYSQDCDRYTASCGACPRLGSHQDLDLSRWTWHRKARAWRELNLTIVTPSSWLAQCVRASSLFRDVRVEVIANGLDTERYKPIDRRTARELLNLPQDKQLILFGALSATGDRRKGFHLLQPALQSLSHFGEHLIEVVVFGSSQPSEPTDLGFRSHYLGRLSDDLSLAVVYAAADVFVSPSTQENLSNTVVEALACGIPCVTFNIGGMSDIIEHQQNGYLAQPDEIEDFARGIAWVLEDKERHQKLCDRARQKAEQTFSLERQARLYSSLFAEIVKGHEESFAVESKIG